MIRYFDQITDCPLAHLPSYAFQPALGLSGSQPWQSTLEAILGGCQAVAVLGPQGLGLWQQRKRDLSLDRQTREAGVEPPLGFLKLNTWSTCVPNARLRARP